MTDAQTLDVVRMILGGQLNQELVACTSQMKLGGKVIGVNGVDAQVLAAHIIDPDLGFVGEIDVVSTDLLTVLLAHHYLPILAPLALGPGGTVLNVNVDMAAACVAKALGAATLLFVSDVPGICQADGTRLTHIGARKAQHMLADGTIREGMIPKVQAAFRVVEWVPHIQIVDGTGEHVVLKACLSHQMLGTTLVPENAPDASAEPAKLAPSEKRHQPGAMRMGQQRGGSDGESKGAHMLL